MVVGDASASEVEVGVNDAAGGSSSRLEGSMTQIVGSFGGESGFISVVFFFFSFLVIL